MCNTTFAVLVRATPDHVKCAVRRTVKVILRRMCEHTIEKTPIHTYIHIEKWFPLQRQSKRVHSL